MKQFDATFRNILMQLHQNVSFTKKKRRRCEQTTDISNLK